MFKIGAPFAPLALGFAGLLPFVLCAFAIVFHVNAPVVGSGAEAARALIIYGAVILSFLGGVRWGVSLTTGLANDASAFVFSVLPSIVGWFAALLPAAAALWTLLAAFLGLGAFDYFAFQRAPVPAWYGRLRLALTAIVAATIAIAAASISP